MREIDDIYDDINVVGVADGHSEQVMSGLAVASGPQYLTGDPSTSCLRPVEATQRRKAFTDRQPLSRPRLSGFDPLGSRPSTKG
jgi:hypothetical protein